MHVLFKITMHVDITLVIPPVLYSLLYSPEISVKAYIVRPKSSSLGRKFEPHYTTEFCSLGRTLKRVASSVSALYKTCMQMNPTCLQRICREQTFCNRLHIYVPALSFDFARLLIIIFSWPTCIWLRGALSHHPLPQHKFKSHQWPQHI